MTGADDATATADPNDIFDGEPALYIGRCQRCETHAQVTDVIVERIDGDLEPVAVELGCGHQLGIDTGLEDDE